METKKWAIARSLVEIVEVGFDTQEEAEEFRQNMHVPKWEDLEILELTYSDNVLTHINEQSVEDVAANCDDVTREMVRGWYAR